MHILHSCIDYEFCVVNRFFVIQSCSVHKAALRRRGILIRAGTLIDSIQLVHQNGQSSGYYGGNGGSQHSYTLSPGESVVAIHGRSGTHVDNIAFVTNLGRVLFGPFGGSVPLQSNRHFRSLWNCVRCYRVLLRLIKMHGSRDVTFTK